MSSFEGVSQSLQVLTSVATWIAKQQATQRLWDGGQPFDARIAELRNDLKFIKTELVEAGKKIEGLQKMIREQLDLAQGRRNFILSLVAANSSVIHSSSPPQAAAHQHQQQFTSSSVKYSLPLSSIPQSLLTLLQHYQQQLIITIITTTTSHSITTNSNHSTTTSITISSQVQSSFVVIP